MGPALTLDDRVEIEVAIRISLSYRAINVGNWRNHSVISREIAHNSNIDGSCRAVSAQRRADASARRPKTSKHLNRRTPATSPTRSVSPMVLR